MDCASVDGDSALPDDDNEWRLRELEIHNTSWPHLRWMESLLQKLAQLTSLWLDRVTLFTYMGHQSPVGFQWGALKNLR